MWENVCTFLIMKKSDQRIIITIFLTLFSFSIQGYGQYHKLIDENKEWIVKERVEDPNSILPDEIHYRFSYFRGDTVLNNIDYKKLYHQPFYRSYLDFSNGQGGVFTIDSVLKQPILVAFLREDTLTEQVFVVSNSFSPPPNEELLFDFSLNVGDTLYSNPLIDFGVVGEIDSIGTLLAGASVRSIHYFDGDNGVSINNLRANYMIEGMGGPGGIIDPFYLLGLGFTLDNEIVCYIENGDSLFGSCNYPNFITDVNDLDFKRIDFKMYPNPGNNQLIIVHDLSNAQGLSIEIIDLQGKKQFVKVVNVNEIKLDVWDLPQGIYFIQLKDADGIIATQKWVKTN